MDRRRPLWLVAAVLLGVAAALLFLLRGADTKPPEPSAGSGSTATATPSPGSVQPVDSPALEAREPKREDAAEAEHGEIHGRVISTETHAGIAGAEVTWSSPEGAHSVTTSEGGRFTFRPPREGDYQLASAKADGYLPFGPQWGKSALAITFRPRQRVTGVTVELTPAPDIVGRVVDPKGAPVPQATARVLVSRKDEIALFPMRDRFTTDSKGEFVFRAEPSAVVEAFHPTLGSGSGRLEPGQKSLVITLEPGAPDAGARVSLIGRVVEGGRPVASAVVRVASALSAYPRTYGSMDGYRELTDDDGRFELTDLQPGTYDVSAHLHGKAPAHRFDVRVPSKDLLLELGSGPKLSGRVSDETGAPVPAFEVTLAWRKAPLERLDIVEAGFIDPDGRYSIEGIASGTYELEVRARGFTEATVPVTIGDHEATADVTLPRGARVTGTVRSAETHAPIAKAKVGLEPFGAATLTDEGGAFALEGMARAGFSLSVSAPAHNTRVVTVVEVSRPIEVELTPVAADAGVKIELVGIGAVLRGRGDALVIGQVMPKAGAATAGLVPGDEIVTVDARAVTELGFGGAIRAIRGPAESPVVLSLRKGGAPPVVNVTVTRRKITN